MANPSVILREEFDDWAVLFDPDTGSGFGLNPIGVYLWRLFDGEHTIDTLLEVIQSHAENVPDEAEEHIGEFVDALAREGLAGPDSSECGFFSSGQHATSTKKPSSHTPGHASEARPFRYERPKLIDLRGERQTAQGDCTRGSGDSGWCKDGAAAVSYCGSGCGAIAGTAGCSSGNCPSYCCTGNSPTSGCEPGSSNFYCCIPGSGCCNGYSG